VASASELAARWLRLNGGVLSLRWPSSDIRSREARKLGRRGAIVRDAEEPRHRISFLVE